LLSFAKARKKEKICYFGDHQHAEAKKVKVLTHRPKRTKTTEVPKPAEGSFASGSDCPALAEAKAKLANVSKQKVITEQQKAKTAEVPKRPAEARAKTAEEPESKKSAEQPKILSPPQETELSKVSEIPAVTPKRRRMANILDVVMESTKVLTPASAEVPNMGEKNTKETAEADMNQVGTEVGPSVPAGMGLTEVVEMNIDARPSNATKTSKECKFPDAEASTEGLEFIVRHGAGKKLSEEQIAEAMHYAKDLTYPPGSLVFNGTDEDDFLCCLPDNKEISVFREMTKNIGFPKLEVGLCAMSKDELANCLSYNSLKVYNILL
jgi:hypothetical protein